MIDDPDARYEIIRPGVVLRCVSHGVCPNCNCLFELHAKHGYLRAPCPTPDCGTTVEMRAGRVNRGPQRS